MQVLKYNNKNINPNVRFYNNQLVRKTIVLISKKLYLICDNKFIL